jgi:hypothetical protein
MRDRSTKTQWVTVRPLVPQQTDSLGDAPIVASDNRVTGFRMKMKVSHSSGMGAGAGRPGRDENVTAFALVRNRDVPPTVTWTPGQNDIIELAGGQKLFVVNAQPAWPIRASIRRPDGGFAGWRLSLADGQPTLSAATQYE